MLHVLFPLNGGSNIVMDFEVDELLQTVGFGEPFHGPFTMLCNATNKITGHADVECPVWPIGENVDVSRHAQMIASVDGRDKPGHDGW